MVSPGLLTSGPITGRYQSAANCAGPQMTAALSLLVRLWLAVSTIPLALGLLRCALKLPRHTAMSLALNPSYRRQSEGFIRVLPNNAAYSRNGTG
jgi:hypothetical protein